MGKTAEVEGRIDIQAASFGSCAIRETMRQTGGKVQAFSRHHLDDPVAGYRPALAALNKAKLGSLVKMKAQIRQGTP